MGAAVEVIMEQQQSSTNTRPGKRVLIVDDNEICRLALAEGMKLMDNSLHVCTAENGEQAVFIVKSTPVDLVITDLRMPVMDGAELTRWLAEGRPSLPVIVMSAYAGTGTIRKLEAHGSHFINKPFDLNHLMRLVWTLLQ
jgi:CheY-like chemotaxis protein